VANPRIDDLRKKLDKEPGSRLFAQLAEELRKEGDLAEAVRVARQGLSHHPNYPSARMTLGRALLDSGDLASARREFETVLKGAADNILASRYLAECLEGLGQNADALARYKATLALAPGDKQVQAKIQALEKGAGTPPAARPAPPEPHAIPAAADPAAPAADEPPPIRLVEVDGPMELTSRYDEATPLSAPRAGVEDLFVAEPETAPAARPTAEAPIAVVPVYEQEFELERPYDARAVSTGPVADDLPPVVLTPEPDDEPILEAEPLDETPLTPEPMAAAPEAPVAAPALVEAPAAAAAPEVAAEAAAPAAEETGEPVLLEADVIDEEFDVETPAAPGPPRVTFRDIVDESIPPMSPEELAAMALAAATASATPAPPAAAPAPAPAATPTPEPELSSPTLAELYFDQGIFEKAIEVYRRLLQREPDNERLRARMGEIEAIQRRAAAPVGVPGSRQEAIGRAIARLQDLRAALVARRD
jgi:tetratricopeptide (TPR) repeat protein